MALGQVSSSYFGFSCNSFYQLLHTYHHPLSGAGTKRQTVTDVPIALSITYLSNWKALYSTEQQSNSLFFQHYFQIKIKLKGSADGV
jgi:hypothetical protein